MLYGQISSNSIGTQRFRLTTLGSLRSLRSVAVVGPVGFAIGVGLLNEFVLEPALPQPLAAAAATLIVATGATIFASWIFRLLSRMQEQMAQMARLEERDLMALKLHDDVIQSIYATQLNLQAILEQQQNEPQTTRESLNKVLDDLTDISIRIRRHIFDLRLQVAGASDLERALGHLMQDVRVNSLITAELELRGPVADRLSGEQAYVLFQVTREVLASAARHAKASHVHVRVSDLVHGVELEITHDGVGLDSGDIQLWTRNGLREMHELAESVGGKLLVDRTNGRGTRIKLRFPIGSTEARPEGRPLVAPTESEPPASGRIEGV